MAELKDMKVAIVCDWLTGIGGAERVVLELHRMFPSAPIYTSQYNPNAIDWFKSADIRTTWLQKLPSGLKKFLPILRMWAFSRVDLSQYDLIISSSGAEAKAVKTGSNTKHIWYCHAPTHYYWSRYDDYVAQPGFGVLDPIARIALKILVNPLRRWDYRVAQKPELVVANSVFTQQKIKQYYGRVSVVVHPPVDIERFKITEARKRMGFVITGRQTPYKRIDLAVRACSELKLPLTVIGNGADHKKLVKMAGPTVKFVTNASDDDIADYLQAAEAFIFPNVDDFGIAAVEALAAGTPVVAYKDGGALDYILPGKTGEFFDEQTVESLVSVLEVFNGRHYNPEEIKSYSEKFSNKSFSLSISKLIDQHVKAGKI